MQCMINRFEDFIIEKKLFGKKNKILIAISGGIDSSVLVDLMVKSGIKCSIAHCNFKLRGQESDEDEVFVYKLSKKYQKEFYSKSFETEKYATDNGISIQMAARELRYSWFEEIREENNFDFIAIAHNMNDIVETFLINMSRGTGLPGLTGIKAKKGKVIRPLLFANRKDIVEYAEKENIQFREDSSNESNKYIRNKIRNLVTPVFNEINPVFDNTMMDNIKRLDETADIFFQKINQERERIVTNKGEFTYIDIPKLQELSSLNTYMYEFLRPYGFSREIIPDIIYSINNISGKAFNSEKFRMIKDRKKFIIYPTKSEIKGQFFIDESLLSFNEPINLEFKLIKRNSKYVVNTEKYTACIDYELLEFPLVLREWKHGDNFMPLGMTSMKKLSDYFIDIKLSIPEKENIWILCSGDNIVWVVGKRLDERYKISDYTETILEITHKL